MEAHMSFLGILLEQAEQILPFWVMGILIGSAISVFGKEKLHRLLAGVQQRGDRLLLASAIGVASPLCMYGTIPIAAALAHKGARQDILAAFMTSSVLLNPQLLIYTAVLGKGVLVARLVTCLLCGWGAGLLVQWYTRRGRVYLNFSGVDAPENSRDAHPAPLQRYLFNVWRNVRATGMWFAIGVLLATVFLYCLPHHLFHHLQVANGENAVEVASMAFVGIPFYVCGGGAIPLLSGWMQMGLSAGAVISFSLTGAGTKITNLSALKMVLGIRHFICYIVYITLFAIAAGICTNLII